MVILLRTRQRVSPMHRISIPSHQYKRKESNRAMRARMARMAAARKQKMETSGASAVDGGEFEDESAVGAPATSVEL